MAATSIYHRLHIAVLALVLVFETGAQETASSNSQTVPAPKTALDAVQDLFKQVQDLRDDVRRRADPQAFVQTIVNTAEQKVKAATGVSRKQLVAQFTKLQRDVYSGDGSVDVASNLEGLRSLDNQIHDFDGKFDKAIRHEARKAEESSRDDARDAEEKADHLARKIDNAARKVHGGQSIAERLDESAEDVTRQIQDNAELAARNIQDKGEQQVRAYEKKLEREARERKDAIKETVSYLKREKAHSQEPTDTPASTEPISAIETSPSAGHLMPLAAIGAGLAASAIVLKFMRRSRDDDMSKYILVV